MAFGIAAAGTIVYNLAPFTASGQAGLFTGPELGTFLHGLHWAYLVGAGLSLCAAFSALFAQTETQQAARP